jgi:hypothetical protein
VTTVTALTGPLEVGAKIGLQVPLTGACDARVSWFDGRDLVVELDEPLAPGSLEEGSIVDLFLSLSWGMYKWLCIVTCVPSEQKVELQLLDAPMFIQRRLDPRVGVGLACEVRAVRSGVKGPLGPAVMADLSHGGLKLEGARQLRAGDIVEVQVELSATLIALSGQLTLVGRVVMAYPSAHAEVGTTDAHVCFIEGQERQLEAVDHFVAQQLKCRGGR